VNISSSTASESVVRGRQTIQEQGLTLLEERPLSPSRALFFQARVNLELFKHMVEQLHALFDKLNYHNFARAFGTCHMNDGIFGELKHSAQMATEKERVLGFLLAMVTSGTASRTRSLVCASMIAAQTGGRCERIFRN
jgi:hypothetical protein